MSAIETRLITNTTHFLPPKTFTLSLDKYCMLMVSLFSRTHCYGMLLLLLLSYHLCIKRKSTVGVKIECFGRILILNMFCTRCVAHNMNYRIILLVKTILANKFMIIEVPCLPNCMHFLRRFIEKVPLYCDAL